MGDMAELNPRPLDPAELDPGIRNLVLLMRKHGFDTCDSGDGVSKPDMGCALDFPHVIAVIRLDDARSESQRVVSLMEAYGVVFGPDEEASVEVSYSPINDVCLLAVYGVTDDMLKQPS